MVKKLHNSLIEFIILAGFDQNTGLQTNAVKNNQFDEKEEIFDSCFEPSLLVFT